MVRPRRRRRTAEEIRKDEERSEPLYRFRWPRDKAGYEIKPSPRLEGDSPLARAVSPDFIQGRGGPLDYYEPLREQPGLWREFAQRCTSPEAAIEFATDYGLPIAQSEQQRAYVPDVISAATNLRQLIALTDALKQKAPKQEAVAFFNRNFRTLATMQIADGTLRPVPVTLLSAMHIQAAEALMGNQVWRHCRSPSCHKSFRLGLGSTKRRQFCDGRCRQAYNRAMKAASEDDSA